MRDDLTKSRVLSRRRGKSARSDRRNGGFALVVVIWGLGVIALLIVAFMSSARLRLQSAFNIASATRAELLAQAAINKSMLALAAEAAFAQNPSSSANSGGIAMSNTGRPPIHNGEPHFCRLSDAVVAISIEDEAGKIDLNVASQGLLKSMLTGFGIGQGDADQIATAILAFRSPAVANGATKTIGGGQQATIQSVFELDQVGGVGADLMRDMIPFVTVHSRRIGVSPDAAPPALFAALAGHAPDEVDALRKAPYPNGLDRADPRFPTEFKQNGASGVFLIHAETLLASGQLNVQEVLVDMNVANSPATSPGGDAFGIRELRRGSPRYANTLRAALPSMNGALPEC